MLLHPPAVGGRRRRPTMAGGLLLTLLGALVPCCAALDQASFYGSSSIAIPLREAKSATDVHFRFRTRAANALILLVAGQTDHCIVALADGRLRVNMNLGAGESELLSSRDRRLDDAQWHEVFIVRKEGDLSLLVDNAHQKRTHLAGDFFELNIHYGLFLGGQGNRTDLFYGHMENFRGCLSEVMYNGMLVLEQARRRQAQAIVHGVTWNCATEFDTDAKTPLSFIEDGAFLTLPYTPQSNHRIHAEFRTILQHSIIVYNSGPVAKPDLFAIEIWEGKLRATYRHADQLHELTPDDHVADGEWHTCTLTLSSTTIDLMLDGRSHRKKISGGLMDFADVVHIGGVEPPRRARAMSKGLRTADASFKGCLRNIHIAEQPRGLQDARATEGLLPGCVWRYGNTSASSDTSRVIAHSGLATDLELLALTPVEAFEGQSVLLTPEHLHVVLDYPKFGVRDSGVKFSVVETPSHGSLSIDVWPKERDVFTLADVSRDKVHYIHDGSETLVDLISLQVEFIASDMYILPGYLQGKFAFKLQVIVASVNDPPVLKINANSILRVPQGGRKIIDADLLTVHDPDSSSADLVYSVLESGAGHFEHNHKPGLPIATFSQIDLEQKKVVYAHRNGAANESHVVLKVSDGIETSLAGRIRVSAFPQHWRLQNNTGLVLVHLTSTLITPLNLSFVSNVANSTEMAQYVIEHGPQYGIVEVEKDMGTWENTVIFTSDDLRQHRVRYRHVTSRPDVDEFQFRTTLNKTQMFTFRMTFARCTLVRNGAESLQLIGSIESAIGLKALSYETDPVQSAPTAILFTIQRAPSFGYLYAAVSKYRMRLGDSFSQEDITLGHVRYHLHQKGYSSIRDHFVVVISAPGCRNTTANVSLEYKPDDEVLKQIRGRITLVKLAVEEGGITPVFTTHLDIRGYPDLVFNITSKPEHGILQVSAGGLRNNTDYFTLKELQQDKVVYIHDDTETRRDSFTFMALGHHKHEDFEYVDTVHVDISLKNDNSPTRLVDKTFGVVVGGARLLTAADLAYTDADLDTRPQDIIYTFKELPNGEFQDAKTRAKMAEFTQLDLDSARVLFQHRGPEYGKVKFWVTDGPYYVSGVLEIQASAPFVRPLLSKRLVVQHGKSAVLSEEHLSYATNLYAGDEDVVYSVIGKPSFGHVASAKSEKIIKEFTQADVFSNKVMYKNDITTSSADEIRLKVTCRDATSTAQISVLMLPASYWEPLHIKTLRQLSVEESTSAIIGRSIVEIIQPQVPASAITYHISTLPENGYLSILPAGGGANYDPSSSASSTHSSHLRTFSQSSLNDNRIIYIQSVANETHDRIVFNVTNGMVWLPNLILDVQIIPERLYLGSGVLSVSEGGAAVITAGHLYIATDYYKSRVTDYVVLEGPQFGCVQIRKRCTKLHGFSQKELVNGLIQYAHDGTENLRDSLVLIAVAGEKRSIPVVLEIKVLPINDETPKLVNNTGLTMWEGGVATITQTALAAVDSDQPKETLKYQVVTTRWGNVSLVSEPQTSLKFFTQELIDRGMVVFRHLNGTDAKFTFNVSDGLHSTPLYTFNVHAQRVELHMRHLRPLHIFPLQRKFLTAAHVLTEVSDSERQVIYEVTTPPSLGRLMMENPLTPGMFNVVSRFTQHDLNNSRVFYEHIHPFAGLYANDSFIFDVKSHLTEALLNKKMKIDISVSSGGLDAYVIIPKIVVDEGGVTQIVLNFSGVVTFLEQHAGVRAPVIHASVEPPHHGAIFLQPNDHNQTTFSAAQLESGAVHYQHDHSDSLGDNLYFALYLLPGYITLCNLTVPIRVTPINDQPFRLVTPAPHLVVVRGENHTISRSELCTEDADTSPAEVQYDIISGPGEGRVILLPAGVTVNHFSQEDVDSGRLVYSHLGGALTDAFHLRVWDGKFRPEYTVFSVRVLEVTLTVTGGLPVYIQQGMNVVLLSPKQFAVRTNADHTKITYTVTTPPRHGVLYVRDSAAESFAQSDLDADRVMYMQRDMTTANDSMVVHVAIMGAHTPNSTSVQKLPNLQSQSVHVDIKVQPLMQLGNCTIIAGEVNRLSLHILDATPLAKLTGGNPRYTITRQPQFGEVRKIIRSSGERRNVLNTLVTAFTHEEVQSGLIYIAVRDIEVPWKGTPDRLGFILAAPIFQPAEGELKLLIRSPLHNDILATLPGPNDPAGHEGGLQYASPNMTRDYFLIVSMVAGVVLLGIAVIIVIKCRSFDPEELAKEAGLQQPLPLPRPPDRLMTASPPLKHAHQASPTATLATPPHCKVTPIDTGTRYPYGSDEHSADEWSSCDASDPSGTGVGSAGGRNNIMLRRNQYWV